MSSANDSLVSVLWGMTPPPRRGPKAQFTLDEVVAMAVDIADSEGLGTVSMEGVARRLGLTKMALYRYVANKGELVGLMVESAIGDPAAVIKARRRTWRSQLEHWARHQLDTWARHPWLPDASSWQPNAGRVAPVARLMGPNEVGMVEAAVATLEGTGLSPGERLEVVFMVSSYNRHSHSTTTSEVLPWDVPGGLSEGLAETMGMNDERYPSLVAARNARKITRWEFGLGCILDGVESTVDKRKK